MKGLIVKKNWLAIVLALSSMGAVSASEQKKGKVRLIGYPGFGLDSQDKKNTVTIKFNRKLTETNDYKTAWEYAKTASRGYKKYQQNKESQ